MESHHGDTEPTSLVACIVQAADAISAARPGARRETLETYTNRLKQLEDITNSFKGVDKSFAIQAGREIRVMVVPEHVTDSDMVLLARNISKQIEAELEYPGQIKVNVIRESRVVGWTGKDVQNAAMIFYISLQILHFFIAEKDGCRACLPGSSGGRKKM